MNTILPFLPTYILDIQIGLHILSILTIHTHPGYSTFNSLNYGGIPPLLTPGADSSSA
jgi:hypothetical protein